MLILIYGEDTYRSREWLRELESKFQEKFDASGYNRSRFSGTAELGEIRSTIVAPPFLGMKRMVVVTGLFAQAGKRDELEGILAHVPESTIVILSEEGDEKTFAKVPFFAKLVRRKEVKSYRFPLLKGVALEIWARQRAKQLGITFERGALPALASRVGADLWQMTAELEKLASLGKPVTVATVEELVHGNTPENIFGFVDAIGTRNVQHALRELKREREHGVPVPYLITMISRQIRMLRSAASARSVNQNITSAELSGLFGWHHFVAKKVLSQARTFSLQELGRASDAAFEADRSIKTGALESDTALDLLVTKIISQN